MSRFGRPFFALLLVAGLLTAATFAEAQQSSTTVRAVVEVAGPPILLETVRNLEFGSVTAGQVKDVTALGPHGAGTVSGGVRFTNLRKQNVHNIRFTLPANLVRGGSSIPVSWSGTQYGSLCVWNNTPSDCNVLSLPFSPAAHTLLPLIVAIPINSPGNNFSGDVYFGGRLSAPATGLVPGLYTGTISVILSLGS